MSDDIKNEIISAFNSNMNSLLNEIIKITVNKIDEKQRSVLQLQGQYQQLKTECQKLQGQNTQLQKEKQQQYQQLHTEYQKLQLQSTQLQTEMKQQYQQLHVEYQKLQRQNTQLHTEIQNINGQAQQTQQLQSENTSLTTKLYSADIKIKEHEKTISDLKKQIDGTRQDIPTREPIASRGSFGSPRETLAAAPAKSVAASQKKEYSGDIVEKFNKWASNHPSSELPREFSYLEGEIKVRTAQYPRETSSKTKWIWNKTGDIKYLFPNPNFFDQMTDISDLYLMDMTRLREKGSNKIRITTPCEVMDSGFINFQGKLELL